MKEIMVNKIKSQTTELLKEMAVELMTNYEEGSITVFNFVLSELEERMSEAEYTAFCDSL
jgi:hypothetical protein